MLRLLLQAMAFLLLLEKAMAGPQYGPAAFWYQGGLWTFQETDYSDDFQLYYDSYFGIEVDQNYGVTLPDANFGFNSPALYYNPNTNSIGAGIFAITADGLVSGA